MNPNVNYIVSGLERSGTSMLMQMLEAGGAEIVYDDKRKADINNPKGYYELYGGKIILELTKKTVPFEKYIGKFIKITSYGLKYLPLGNYKIIYIERNIDEIINSREKMIGKKYKNKEETKQLINKTNRIIKAKMKKRSDVKMLIVNYNRTIKEPSETIEKIWSFLPEIDLDIEHMFDIVDKNLYRQRADKK